MTEIKCLIFDRICKEIFVQIKEFENYEISNYGKVRNKKTNKILKPTISKTGYYRVRLHKQGIQFKRSIHRLIAQHFLYEHYFDINHKDRIKENNHVSNLEYVTKSENQLHRWRVKR